MIRGVTTGGQREVDASADRGRLPDVIAAVGEGHPEERGILEGACEAGGHGQRQPGVHRIVVLITHSLAQRVSFVLLLSGTTNQAEGRAQLTLWIEGAA